MGILYLFKTGKIEGVICPHNKIVCWHTFTVQTILSNNLKFILRAMSFHVLLCYNETGHNVAYISIRYSYANILIYLIFK